MSQMYHTGTGRWIRVHGSDRCSGEYCVIHNPMRGPWSSWLTHWRSDRGIMERICPDHGVGHPVAEDYARLPDWELIHGCCGCPCRPGAVKE